jgi:adenine-specific DNA-methyltransferase
MLIQIIESSDPQGHRRHARIVSLVECILERHLQLSASKGEQERTMLQRQIEAIDRLIDAQVYELYGLTEEEIRIEEEAAK